MIFAVSYVPRTPPSHPRRAPQRPPQWVFRARRVAALTVLAIALFALVRCVSLDDAPPPPAPQATETADDAEASRSIAPEYVEDSRPAEMVVPVIGLRAPFEDGDCRVVDGAIDPASMTKACAYTAPEKPYSLPGTDAGDIVVVAGHTGAGVNAVFNELYDSRDERHTVAEGDSLYLRTEASGEAWLKYTATDVHDPEKNALAGDPEIWGSGPMPGRLLTISCIQPTNLLAESVRNAVVGWQFAGTVTGDVVEAAFQAR